MLGPITPTSYSCFNVEIERRHGRYAEAITLNRGLLARDQLLAVLHEFQKDPTLGLVEYTLSNFPNFHGEVIKFGVDLFVLHVA
jgi:hypothetical protein